MFEDTFHYMLTVGWMFLLIEVFQGGGDAAKFERLEHIKVRRKGMFDYAFYYTPKVS